MRVCFFLILVLILTSAAAPQIAGAVSSVPVVPAQSDGVGQPAATFSIGLPAGDGYGPCGVVVDEVEQLAYVCSTDSPERRPVISVVNLATRQPVRVISLASGTPGGLGRVLLAGNGRLLFADQLRRTLTAIDPETGRLTPLLTDVRDAVADPDGTYVYVLTSAALRAYRAASLRPRAVHSWEVRGAFDRVVPGADSVAVLRSGDPAAVPLAVYGRATGTEVARATLTDPVNSLAAGPGGSWVAVTTGEKPKLRRLDAGLRQTHETEIPYAYEVSYDSPRGRYLLSGFRFDGRTSSSEILAFDAGDLRKVAARSRPGSEVPTLFVNWGQDRILGYSRGGPSRLDVLSADLAETDRIIFGVRPVDMVLDGVRGHLFVADDHDRVHVLALPGGEVRDLWEGGAPLAFDEKNNVLYANLPGKVVALDGSGRQLAEFPQEGAPAPDPNRDLVYIVSNGVTMYDRAGKKLGELKSTFPTPGGFVPNTYAQSAYVNPVSGYVAVILNNGVPGSNNGSFLRVYPPKADTPVQAPGVYSFVTDVAFDPAGSLYVTYSPAKTLDAVQVLDSQGRELRKLAGRSGRIALDAAARTFYLVTSGLITQAATDTLTPSAFFAGPQEVERVRFSPARQALYVYGGLNPWVRAIPLADLSPVDMRPQAAAPVSDAYLEQLYTVAAPKGEYLIARYSDGLYRTRDGKRWEKLPVGTVASWRYLAVAPKGVLFWAGQGYDGGDGVWRSTDAGDTWEPLLDGLRDLRFVGSGITAASPDEAYAISRTGALLRWSARTRVWERLNPGETPAQSPGELRAAPGGKELFHSAWELLRKSTDGGSTWQSLSPPARSGNIIGFSGFYTVTHTLYGMWGDTVLRPMRSTDGGASWRPLNLRVDLSRDYQLPVIASSGWDTYMLARPYTGDESILLRSTDNGDSWQRAPAAVSRGVVYAVQATDGRLWLGGAKGVRAVNPGTIKWTAASAQPTATPTARPPAPPPTRQPTPTWPPCSQVLAAPQSEVAARAPELGCPADAAKEVPMARQSFEHGQMIWRSDVRTIYVMTNGGWRSYEDRWAEGEAESDPGILAPQGLEQPVRGFGKVWREQLGGPAAAIGWALERERGVPGVVQEWDRGVVFRFGSETIILLDNGRVK